MTKCNELLTPIFKEITQLVKVKRSLGENDPEYEGKHATKEHSKRYSNIDYEIGMLYNKALDITKQYNSFDAVCNKSDCWLYIATDKKIQNHCKALQCADYEAVACPFYHSQEVKNEG